MRMFLTFSILLVRASGMICQMGGTIADRSDGDSQVALLRRPIDRDQNGTAKISPQRLLGITDGLSPHRQTVRRD
jgi:hypothetical protein